jgi:hypothetical protein
MGQDPGGQHPGQAPANDHGMSATRAGREIHFMKRMLRAQVFFY